MTALSSMPYMSTTIEFSSMLLCLQLSEPCERHAVLFDASHHQPESQATTEGRILWKVWSMIIDRTLEVFVNILLLWSYVLLGDLVCVSISVVM